MKVIIFLLMLTSFVFAQQLNYTFGVNGSGVALTGSFTDLDSTGTTSYSVYVDLTDSYIHDANPLVHDTQDSDSTTAYLVSSDKAILFTLYYGIDGDTAGDSIEIDVDVSSGVYTSTALAMASVMWDPTPVNNGDLQSDADMFGHINVYTEAGKLYPPPVVRVTFDVDPTVAEVSAGLDIYYVIVYPQIYEDAREKYRTSGD